MSFLVQRYATLKVSIEQALSVDSSAALKAKSISNDASEIYDEIYISLRYDLDPHPT
jgi:hypothetical protein